MAFENMLEGILDPRLSTRSLPIDSQQLNEAIGDGIMNPENEMQSQSKPGMADMNGNQAMSEEMEVQRQVLDGMHTASQLSRLWSEELDIASQAPGAFEMITYR